METPRECYEMAEECERKASTVKNEQARQLLLEVAAKWRQMGDALEVDAAPTSRPSSQDGWRLCASPTG